MTPMVLRKENDPTERKLKLNVSSLILNVQRQFTHVHAHLLFTHIAIVLIRKPEPTPSKSCSAPPLSEKSMTQCKFDPVGALPRKDACYSEVC